MTSKRLFDVIFSLIAIILYFPLFVVITLLIKLTSKGPVLFCQCRMGLGGEAFTILKFRTMRDGSGQSGVDLTSKNDSRITSIGRFLRRSRLDELPQFLNVLMGDMSVVGPRPYEMMLARQFNCIVEHATRRYEIKPGITGLAQINGRKGKTIKDLEEDLEYDLEYNKKWSMDLDISICLKTIPVILTGKGI